MERMPVCGQKGAVLIIALVVLVAMTLASIAMVRSVDTANVISGNLAFKQSTIYSADIGAEAAISWLEANNTGSNLWKDDPKEGYTASKPAVGGDPAPDQTWDEFWGSLPSKTLKPDSAGNTVSYTIQRMCMLPGNPNNAVTRCALSPTPTGTQPQWYYRITTRVAGPRNTLSFVQMMVAL